MVPKLYAYNIRTYYILILSYVCGSSNNVSMGEQNFNRLIQDRTNKYRYII